METPSLAYLHAEATFDKLRALAINSAVTIQGRRLVHNRSHVHNTDQLVTWGQIGERAASQSFSRSDKTGMFYLTTTFAEYGGEVVHRHIGPQSDIEAVDTVANSLFREVIDLSTPS